MKQIERRLRAIEQALHPPSRKSLYDTAVNHALDQLTDEELFAFKDMVDDLQQNGQRSLTPKEQEVTDKLRCLIDEECRTLGYDSAEALQRYCGLA